MRMSWDWNSWLSNIALRQILAKSAHGGALDRARRAGLGVEFSRIRRDRRHHRHARGLYFWQTDMSIGVDNDPCTYYRPPRSSGSIYLNTLMFKEF